MTTQKPNNQFSNFSDEHLERYINAIYGYLNMSDACDECVDVYSEDLEEAMNEQIHRKINSETWNQVDLKTAIDSYTLGRE